MPTIVCECGWSVEDESETMCWYEWINHDVEMYKTKDEEYHAAVVIEEKEG